MIHGPPPCTLSLPLPLHAVPSSEISTNGECASRSPPSANLYTSLGLSPGHGGGRCVGMTSTSAWGGNRAKREKPVTAIVASATPVSRDTTPDPPSQAARPQHLRSLPSPLPAGAWYLHTLWSWDPETDVIPLVVTSNRLAASLVFF